MIGVRAALAVAPALLGHREVVADRRAVETGEVLLAGREVRGVRAVDEQGGVRERLRAGQEVVAPGERVEVVVLDGVEPVVRAALRPTTDDPRQRPPLRGGAYVEQPLAPRLVDDRAPVVLQHQVAMPAPEATLVRLGLEAVDVADVVPALERRRVTVTHDDADVGGDVADTAELVVDVGAGRQQREQHRQQETADHRATLEGSA